MSDPAVFQVIDQLIASLPLDAAKVGKIMGTQITRDADNDTPAVEAWAQPDGVAAGPYESVDLRMSDADIGDGTTFLSATMRSDQGVTEEAIGERYGLDFETEVPSPRVPPGSVPVYLTYEHDWGSLSFGVSPDDDRKLVRFIVSTHAPADEAE